MKTLLLDASKHKLVTPRHLFTLIAAFDADYSK